MSSIVGGIEIQMAADLARLRRDMADAKALVGSAATSLQATANTVKTAFAAIGLGLSVAGFSNWIKNAINAADETFNLSQKVGVAAQDLAGLKLAFGQAGVGSDGMQTALVKLSKNVAEGNEAFARMGVSVRASDGTLKTSKQVLYDVADVFAAMPDGINKTALATDVFGKAGADLVPMLNQGSKGMEEMATMAEKLGLVIDDKTAAAADQFNDTLDLLGKGMDGVGTQVAAQLLPTLNNLAGSMLTAMTSGDRLKNVAAVLGTALKGLYSIGLGLVGGFTAVGQTLGGLAAGAMLIAQGEFRQAAVAMSAAWDDAGDTIQATKVEIVQAWDDTGSKTVEAGVAMTRAQEQIGTSTKAAAEEQKKAAADANKHAAELLKLRDAGNELLHSIVEKNATVQAEIALGRELTAQEKEVIDLEKKLKDGKVIMSAAVEAQARAQIDLNAQLEAHRRLQESEKTLAADIAKDKADIIEALGRETLALQDAAEKQREQNLELQLGKDAYTQLTITRLLDLATEKEQIATTSDQSEELLKQAKALRDRAALLQDGVVLTEARAAADEWAKTTASINDGLTDALFRAFESGKSFGLTLRDSLVNTFKTTVLKPVIQAVMAPVSGAIGSLFSGGASAASGALGGLGNIGSMLGGLGSMGSAFSGGFGLTMSGLGGTGLALEGAGAMMGSGSMMAGIGQAAGALGPYALAALAVYGIAKSLDKSGTPHMGSVVGTDAAGQYSMFGDASTIMNNYNGDTDAALRSISGLSVGALNGLSAQFGGAANFNSVAKFASDGQDASIGLYELNQGTTQVARVGGNNDYGKYSSNAADAYAAFANDIAAATASAVGSINLPKWARDQFDAIGTDATVEEFGMLADSVIATQSALRSLTEGINPLGGIFTTVAGLSSDALFELTNFAGGIDAFAQKASSFAQTYYSAEEQAGIQARDIVAQLSGVGISSTTALAGMVTKDEFRALVESRDLTTSLGREQLATLLDIAPTFAALTEYFAANGGNLITTAANAPTTALLENVMSSTLEQSAAVVSGAVETNALMQRLLDAMNSGNTTLVAALTTSTEVQRAVAASGSATLEVMTRVDNKLGQIESNGSLNNAAPGVYGPDPNLQT